jgi:hypothetical protein
MYNCTASAGLGEEPRATEANNSRAITNVPTNVYHSCKLLGVRQGDRRQSGHGDGEPGTDSLRLAGTTVLHNQVHVRSLQVRSEDFSLQFGAQLSLSMSICSRLVSAPCLTGYCDTTSCAVQETPASCNPRTIDWHFLLGSWTPVALFFQSTGRPRQADGVVAARSDERETLQWSAHS